MFINKIASHLSQAWNFCQSQYHSPIVSPSKTIEKLRINCYFDLETNCFLTVNRKYSFILRKKNKIKKEIEKAARQRKKNPRELNSREINIKDTLCKRGLVERITQEKSYIPLLNGIHSVTNIKNERRTNKLEYFCRGRRKYVTKRGDQVERGFGREEKTKVKGHGWD